MKISKKLLLILLFFVIKAGSVNSQGFDLLKQKIDSLQASPILESGYLSVSLKNCRTGQDILSINARKALKPASNMKLITTATALGILGEDYRYKTKLLYTGQITDSTLHGNIIIKASGDPTLGSKRFKTIPDYEQLVQNWAQAIHRLGIKNVTGSLQVDQSVFEPATAPDTWQWGDLGNYYGAASYGLNYNENMFTAFFSTSRQSGTAANLLQVFPRMVNFNIDNQVLGQADTKGDNVLFYSSPLSNNLLAKGSLPTGRQAFSVRGAMINPAQTLLYMLGNALSQQNILVYNKSEQSSPDQHLILEQVSPSLHQICSQTNIESINVFAESMLKTIGLQKYGLGSDANGIKALREYWLLKGVNLKAFDNRDGSGLSASNYLSTQNMVDILAIAANEKYFTAFYQSIPIVGEEGTVRNFAKNSPAAGKVRAKSGTIDKVKAYSGYYYDPSGQLMCFSIIANQYDAPSSYITRELGQLIGLMCSSSP
jgi:serine-type D-Ala-D-Ala carboxypeptidase/endopeptidase (penicillin-binding protein 4)